MDSNTKKSPKIELIFRYLLIISLFLITNFVILSAYWAIMDALNNVADASCYDGRIVYDWRD